MKRSGFLIASLLTGCLDGPGGEALPEEEACALAGDFVEDATWYLADGEEAEDVESVGCGDFLSKSEEGLARIRVDAEYDTGPSTEDMELDCYLEEWDQGWEVTGCAVL